MADTTFDERDVVRIYLRHLDEEEKLRVREWFAIESIGLSLEDMDVLWFLSLEGRRTAQALLTLAQLNEAVLLAAGKLADDDDVEASNAIRADVVQAIEQVDAFRREFRSLADSVPGGRAVFNEVDERIREVRGVMRRAVAVLGLPEQLLKAERDITKLADEAAELVQWLDELHRIWPPGD